MHEMMKMMHAYQAKTDAVLPAMQVMETSHKETAAVIEPETEANTMAYQEIEAHQEEEEPTSADRKPKMAKQREAPVDDAEVMPVGEPKKKSRRDRKLAAEHRRQKPKTSTRENCGPQKDWPSPAEGQAAVRKRHGIRSKPTRRCPVARQWHDA
jgi:rubrerythrin